MINNKRKVKKVLSFTLQGGGRGKLELGKSMRRKEKEKEDKGGGGEQ